MKTKKKFSLNTHLVETLIIIFIYGAFIFFVLSYDFNPRLTGFFIYENSTNESIIETIPNEILNLSDNVLNNSQNEILQNVPNFGGNDEEKNTTKKNARGRRGGGGGGNSNNPPANQEIINSSSSPLNNSQNNETNNNNNSSLVSNNITNSNLTNGANNNSIINTSFNNSTNVNNSTNGNKINQTINNSIIINNSTNKPINVTINNSSGNNNQTSNVSQSSNTTSVNPVLNQTNNNNNHNNGNQNLNQTNNGNQNNNVSSNLKIFRGSAKNIKSVYKLRYNDLDIKSSDVLEGKYKLKFLRGSKYVAQFDINFSKDIDFSNVEADSDLISGKAFFHHPNIDISNIALFIPIKSNDSQIRICSNASRFDQIYEGCINDPEVTSEYVLTRNSPQVTLSDDGLYFIVSGITGTGGVGEPGGANVTSGTPQTAPSDLAGNASAYAGNISFVSLSGYSTTQSWQGYFGNVSGVIQLADNSDNIFYNWTAFNPSGEVYASTNNSILWTNIQCFNFTSSGNISSEDGQGGTTSKAGVNLTMLESWYNISSDDVDGVNETFYLIGPGTHDAFFSMSRQFDEGECPNTRIFNVTGPSSNEFEEVLLYEPNSTSIIYTSILDKDLRGFNNETSDFEMIVLENGHGTDIFSTPYYFYVDLY